MEFRNGLDIPYLTYYIMKGINVSNPIPHSSLFATPESLQALDQQIRQLPDAERAIAYQYTMLAFNYAHKLTEEASSLNQGRTNG